MSEMTPQQAADLLEAEAWWINASHLNDALRILIDHARAAAPEVVNAPGFVAVTEAWAVWLDETAAQDEEMTDGERSGFRVAATHLRAPVVRERVARVAAPEGDLAAWLDQQIADVAGRVADCDRRGWDNAATSLGERHRALQDVRDRLPGSVAAPPREDEAAPAPDEVDSDGDEIWERGSHTVTRSGRDVHLSWSGKTLVSDPAGLSAALLAAAAPGTVRDPERGR